MPYPTQFLRFTYVFDDNGAEIAECGVNVGATVGTPADLFSLIDDTLCGELITAYIGNLITPGHLTWADYGRLRGMRVALLGTDGHQVGDAFEHEEGTPPVGSVTEVPPQCSIAIGLLSGETTGYANYGRMYLPYTKLSLQYLHSNVSSAAAAAFSTDAAAFVSAFNEAITGLGGISGTSGQIINISKKGSGIKKAVIAVRIAQVIETQRRRYNQTPPNYHVTALT